MIQIIPAIDIIDGRCVRLCQGDYDRKKVYDSSPVDAALAFADAGVQRIHLVDLDGAKASRPCNLKTLEAIAGKICGKLRLEWGGGIKTEQDLQSCRNAGCTDAVIGSTAAKEPDTFKQWLTRYGAEAIVLGADVKDGKIAIKGWLESSELHIANLLEDFIPSGLSQCIVTEISRDGMLQGPATELYVSLKEKWSSITLTASGGVSSMEDIISLNDKKIDRVITGKAFYEGRITLKDIEKWSLNA